jgi:hypothetical protein
MNTRRLARLAELARGAALVGAAAGASTAVADIAPPQPIVHVNSPAPDAGAPRQFHRPLGPVLNAPAAALRSHLVAEDAGTSAEKSSPPDTSHHPAGPTETGPAPTHEKTTPEAPDAGAAQVHRPPGPVLNAPPHRGVPEPLDGGAPSPAPHHKPGPVLNAPPGGAKTPK